MNLVKKALALGFGLGSLTQEKVNKLAKDMMKGQGISEKQARSVARQIIATSMKTQRKVNALVVKQAYAVLKKAGVATRKDLNDMERRLKKSRQRGRR